MPEVHALHKLANAGFAADAQVVDDGTRHAPAAAGLAGRAAGSPAIEPPAELLGARQARLHGEWRTYLASDVYPEVQTMGSPRRVLSEIDTIAGRLAHASLTPQQAAELYDQHIRPAHRHQMVGDRLASALPYQAAAVVADQVLLPAMRHLPLGVGATVAGVVAAAADQFGQGVVGEVMVRKGAAHRWPRDRFAPALLRLLERSPTASRDDATTAVLLPTAAILGKNALRTAGTVALAAMGAPNGLADAFGILTDLTVGTAGAASGGIVGSRRDRREDLRRFLAFKGAAALLRHAARAQATTPAKPSMTERLESTGQSIANTASQAVRSVPAGVRAVFSWPTVAKVGVLAAANIAGQVGDRQAEEWFATEEGAEKPLIDASVRRRRDAAPSDLPAASGRERGGDAPQGEGSAALTSPAADDATSNRSALLKQLAVRESLATGVGGATAAGLSAIDQVRDKVERAVERRQDARSGDQASGLRRRQPWSTQQV